MAASHTKAHIVEAASLHGMGQLPYTEWGSEAVSFLGTGAYSLSCFLGLLYVSRGNENWFLYKICSDPMMRIMLNSCVA